MNPLYQIIQILRPDEKTKLQSLVAENDSLPYQIIKLSAAENISTTRLCKTLGISGTSVAKNISIAKAKLLEVIKQSRSTQYDDIMIVQHLYLARLDQLALKEYHQLVKKYELLQLYPQLDILHHEAVRIYYGSCNVKELEKLIATINHNMDRLVTYTKLDKQLIYEMAVLEKGSLKLEDLKTYEARLLQLYDSIKDLGHHVLLINCFHCLYELYTRYDISLPKAINIVAQMEAHLNRNKNNMSEYTFLVQHYHIAHFHCLFRTDSDPAQLEAQIFEQMSDFQELLKLSCYLSFMIYYFATGAVQSFNRLYKEMSAIHTEGTSYAYLASLAGCLASYLSGEHTAFNRFSSAFYNAEVSRNYVDYELMIRHLEILLLLKRKDYTTIEDKIKANIIFTKRNFTQQRFLEENSLFNAYRKVTKLKIPKAFSQNQFHHRFSQFLLVEIGSLNVR